MLPYDALPEHVALGNWTEMSIFANAIMKTATWNWPAAIMTGRCVIGI